MKWHLALTRLLVVALGLAIVAPDALAAPRRAPARASAKTPAKSRATTSRPAKKATPTRAGGRGDRSAGRTRAPARSNGRTMAAAKVMIAGSLRPPSEPTGRMPAKLTREEAAAEAIEKILRGPLRYGTTGLYVVDAETGRELFAVHPDDPLNPASNVKLVSTATALDLLGPQFRYATRLLGPTAGADGAVGGDVYLLGSYDPTLSRDGLTDLARQVAASGVTRIDGDVVAGRASRDGIWRSRIGIEIAAREPGHAPAVTVLPRYDLVEVVNTATTGKRARVKGGLKVEQALVTRDDGTVRLRVTVSGTIGKGKSTTRWLSTGERHLHAAHLLRAALRDAGVAVSGDVRVAELPVYVEALARRGHLAVPLGEHTSAPLATIIAQINKRSINWLSDRVVATAAALTGNDGPSMGHGVDAMYRWIERATGLPRTSMLLDTGSGLSYRTELSPRQIVQVVRSAAGLAPHQGADPARVAECADAFIASLSVAGVDGTLRGRFRRGDLRGRIHGKTGTLSTVIALSGLLDGPAGRRLAFSLVTNGHSPGRKLAVRLAHEQIVQVLDDYLRGLAADVPPEPIAPVELVPEMPAVGDGLDDEDPDANPGDAVEPSAAAAGLRDDLGDDAHVAP
ncbi:MAG TPA: D-alanyl-D-alanine carboxypeptidase [Kofleriaceae bacterium]|nr:D-alanyl-D-alanine carboxypeptidase [Kofleriaceae bacterium]